MKLKKNKLQHVQTKPPSKINSVRKLNGSKLNRRVAFLNDNSYAKLIRSISAITAADYHMGKKCLSYALKRLCCNRGCSNSSNSTSSALSLSPWWGFATGRLNCAVGEERGLRLEVFRFLLPHGPRRRRRMPSSSRTTVSRQRMCKAFTKFSPELSAIDPRLLGLWRTNGEIALPQWLGEKWESPMVPRLDARCPATVK